MQQLLVLYNDNWADEIALDGFRIMTEEEWETYKDLARSAHYPLTWNVGTNEEMNADAVDDILDYMTEQPISNTEAQIITQTLGDEYGIFPNEDIYEEEE